MSNDNSINNVNIGRHLPVAFDDSNDIEVTLTHTITSNLLSSKVNFGNAICDDDYVCSTVDVGGPGKGCIVPVFRPIDLKNPFPDQDGNNRQTGLNWCSSEELQLIMYII